MGILESNFELEKKREIFLINKTSDLKNICW